MRLPDAIRSEVEAVLNRRILDVRAVGGGCISHALRLEAEGGSYFLKWGEEPEAAAMFAAEAFSLGQLAACGAVQVPGVIGAGQRWLLLEWLEPERASDAGWTSLGARLAALHGSRGDRFGWAQDNFIGSLPQSNERTDGWAGFWRQHRLEPQLERARGSGLLSRSDAERFEELFARLPELLAAGQAEGASLLHGDLWSGNVHATGESFALIDPSCYYGHREVDLAMAALFGGLPRPFWREYERAAPLECERFQSRRAAYQLYYLLVHVNLFGAGYVGGTRSALTEALSAK